MKIVPVGHSIVTDKGTYLPGKSLEVDDTEGKYLIGIGAAKAFDAKADAAVEKAEKEAMEATEAAERRKALETKALEIKVGTVEEIAKLSDGDLKAKITSALGSESKSFFEKLFNKG